MALIKKDTKIVETMEGFYKTNSNSSESTSFKSNWYLQKPYAIVFTDRYNAVSTFYLPISPSNLNITTHFATNIISTMYGTVEEHSEQRYYDIQIAGTTGMSPRFYRPINGDFYEAQAVISPGRLSYVVQGLIPGGLGGFFKRSQDLITNSLNQASDILGDDAPKTGIDLNKTGYVAFHNLYKFLLSYKKDTSGADSKIQRRGHPLKFVNYKDNNQYDVAIQTFQLTRDAGNPMLYNYNIIMRAYNLRNADASGIQVDIEDRLVALGLDGISSSFFASMANKAKQAKNAAYSAVASVKGFGR